MKRRFPVLVLLAAWLAMMLTFSPLSLSRPIPVAASAATLRDVPPDAQSLLSNTLGRDDPSYAAVDASGGYRFDNAAQGLTAEFDATGVRVTSGEVTFGLALQAYGYAEAMQVVMPVEPQVKANRVEYGRGALTEWYVNGPLGLEQGFTVTSSPAGDRRGELTLTLAWSGNVQVQEDEGGTGLVLMHDTRPTALRYTGLSAYDATGRALRAWLQVGTGGVTPSLHIHVDDTDAQYPLTIDPYMWQAKLTNAGAAANDSLGWSLAVSADGSIIIAGLHRVSTAPGAVYVFVKPGSGWATTSSPTAILTNATGAASEHIGYSVAISGDGSTITAGATGVNSSQGAVYVFVKPAGGWVTTGTPTAMLTNAGGAAYDNLGISVAISADGSTIVAGPEGANGYSGAAYVFVKPGGGWATTGTPTATLTSSIGATQLMGHSVAISSDGSTIVAGAPLFSSNMGAAYVFVEPGGGWATTSDATAILTNAGGAMDDQLGRSVAISADGSTIVAGAYGADSDKGAAQVFVKPGGGWATTDTPTATLTNAAGVANDWLGDSVAIDADGSTIVAGALGVSSCRGAAYVFVKPGGGWATTGTPRAALINSGGAASEYLGWSVAVSVDGATIVAGAFGANSVKGAVYVNTVLFPPVYLPTIMR